MNGLTWSRIRRLISRKRIQRAACGKDWLKQRKFYFGKVRKERKTDYEKAACLNVGDFPEKREAYGMAESEKGLMAVLAAGNERQDNKTDTAFLITRTFEELFQRKGISGTPDDYFQSAWEEAGQRLSKGTEDLQYFSAAAILVRGQTLWYCSCGGFKAVVCRSKKFFLLPTGKCPLLLKYGDYVILMSPGLCKQVSKVDIKNCLNKKGSCEEMALRLVNLSCGDRKGESIDSAVVVIRVK